MPSRNISRIISKISKEAPVESKEDAAAEDMKKEEQNLTEQDQEINDVMEVTNTISALYPSN